VLADPLLIDAFGADTLEPLHDARRDLGADRVPLPAGQLDLPGVLVHR